MDDTLRCTVQYNKIYEPPKEKEKKKTQTEGRQEERVIISLVKYGTFQLIF